MEQERIGEKTAKPSKRLAYIDVLNVIAALSVVVLHCNGCFWLGPAQGRSWISANIIESTLYWPVSIFFMITGVTLMGYRSRMTTKSYFGRRVSRTVVPFVAWSIFGLVWCVATAPSAGEPIDLSPLAIVEGILNTRYTGVYWFFPPLFAIYLSIPILSLLINNRRILLYVVAVGVATVFVAPLVCGLLGIIWNESLVPPPVAGYVVYVVLGYLLSTQELTKRQRIVVYVLGVVGWAMQLFGTFALSSVAEGVSFTFKGYTNLPVLLQATAVFTFVRNMDFEGNGILRRVAALCRVLSGATFGVYLMHWYPINFFERLRAFSTMSVYWRIGGALVIFVACAVLTLGIKRVPLLKRLVP